jgi:Flp pilus assembly pilin Flp
MLKKTGLLRSVRGQGMTEYIIIVALIAVAAIGTYSLFGKTVRAQSGAMAASLGGDAAKAGEANSAANTAGGKAADLGKEEKTLANFTEDVGEK